MELIGEPIDDFVSTDLVEDYRIDFVSIDLVNLVKTFNCSKKLIDLMIYASSVRKLFPFVVDFVKDENCGYTELKKSKRYNTAVELELKKVVNAWKSRVYEKPLEAYGSMKLYEFTTFFNAKNMRPNNYMGL